MAVYRKDNPALIHHRAGAGRSRQGRQVAGILTLAVAILAAAALSSGGAVAAPGDDPDAEALARARVDLAYCTAALESDDLSPDARAEAGLACELAEAVIAELGPQPTPSGTASPPAQTPTPTPVPSTSGTPPPTTPPPTSNPPGPAAGFPNASTTGTPAGWAPASTRSTDLRVTQAGVVQDIRLTNGADIIVAAAGVTIRRVELQGGRIDLMPAGTCFRTRIEDSTFRRPGGTVTDADQEGAITPGGWNVDGAEFDGVTEGLRAGQKAACGANAISNSFLRIQAPDVCADWHGDGIQGFDGGAVTVRNVTIDFQERSGCGGTAPFFYPRNQGNTSVDIDRLLVRGGGYSFRNGMPGRVASLKIVNGEWGYGPIDVRCSVLSEWSAQIVTVNAAWQPTTVRAQACGTEGGT